MSHNTFGHLFRVTTFGESHGPLIGCVVDGCPPGLALDLATIQGFLDRRRPGQSRHTTQRREPDEVRLVSGVMEEAGAYITTGTPIGMLIDNVDQRSKDYSRIADRFRPGHADYTYDAKYGLRDPRGGGRSSARETAMRVAAGGIARAVIPDVTIRGALVELGGDPATARDWTEVERNDFFAPDAAAAARWAERLDQVRRDGSSVGAVVEVEAHGVPAGWGAPLYAKLDADLAAAMMSINAVKGVEIGAGFHAARLTGEENADEMRSGNDGPRFLSNNAGGVLGGISTGAPVVVRFAVKPTSSIRTSRRSITAAGEEVDVATTGRHDPCVGIRAVPVGEAMMAIVLADHFLRHAGRRGAAEPFAAGSGAGAVGSRGRAVAPGAGGAAGRGIARWADGRRDLDPAGRPDDSGRGCGGATKIVCAGAAREGRAVVIVACGEALVDLMPETIAGELVYRPVLGGSLANVALGVARLGGRAGYLWELSTDRLGAAFHAHLTQAGVDCRSVRRTPRATPAAIVDLTGPEPRYNIADPDRVMHDTTPPALPAGAEVLVIGSAVLAQEPVGSAIEALAATAPLLAIDYNVRKPSICDLAAYRARLWRLSAAAGIAKASTADLDLIEEPDAEAAMQRFVVAGAGIAVLTRGADGATAWTASGRADVPTQAQKIVDAVGAGDAFMAGLLAALQRRGLLARPALRALQSHDLAALLGEAQRVAAATCAVKGAVMPSALDLAGTAGQRVDS